MSVSQNNFSFIYSNPLNRYVLQTDSTKRTEHKFKFKSAYMGCCVQPNVCL